MTATMVIIEARVRSVREVADGLFVLRCHAPGIALHVAPGQFVNIRVHDGLDPYLRRPFSVYRTEGEDVEFLFNVVGNGTAYLRAKRGGDTLDLLGPLGVPFGVDSTSYDTALLVGGGLGVAPLPLARASAGRAGKIVHVFAGFRTASQVLTAHLGDVRIATDDGSAGDPGTVVALLERFLEGTALRRPKIFGCGPNRMLRALAEVAAQRGIPCEVSLEGPMGCGFGICQGCPVERTGPERTYALMCKDGPTFDAQQIVIPA
jgi:dihydroorotate dehydrogenase electron transfer subunit